MGCVASRIDKEGRVKVCKERKMLMKQLVGYRGEFAAAQFAYLRALRNTGVTLRQFTESDSLELENISYGLILPPPPPPPSFGPDFRKAVDSNKGEAAQEESIEINQGEELVENTAVSPLPEKPHPGEIVDDNSSMMSWYNKDSPDAAMVVWKNNTLEGIIKELDDYFLKASAGGKEIAVFTDINIGDNSVPWKLNENKRKRSNSANVFSALSWSWSSKSLQFARYSLQCGSSDPCMPGAHCITLDKLYDAEQKLYKEIKEEEITKLEHERKLMLLQKLDENHDQTKTEKIQSSVENLETDIRRLQHSISINRSSILKLIDEELYPQLVALTLGLMDMWKMMYKSHQVQNHISQQLNHLTDNLNVDLTTESHRQATAQLESEVSFWYHSFCKLIKSQQEYVRTLCRWIQLTDCLADDHQQNRCLSAVSRICEEWQLGFENLPDKVASEAIKSFLLAIQSIIRQQAEEYNQQKKCAKLEKRLQKESTSLTEMEKKVERSVAASDMNSTLSPKHPLSVKSAKTEALKKRVDMEKGKHLNSVQVCKTMTLNNLKTTLPNVFKALMGFSKASALAFEAIHGHTYTKIPCNESETQETKFE
ncbi:nitrate regulatory gene2 protein-like [Durio zibethinus]|uniref:Nitrate regulatory gene2 protein-like n=1 Tax=Durio zibethinus TaxID=66656 RepID=A0A6P5Z9R6_DURZI|nr:nitrate regulatory gene2 protein-like [Durio zibethinus]XP_022749247.1 nitrate regulatory gene2 protein-like [Durio zibethinus]XP_022749248.1 nitrate regulatory gene2 protein-like [Durio zibethinus]